MVALRKESVDRNDITMYGGLYGFQSLSARRAWIEINSTKLPTGGQTVALRKESVDRNDIADLTAHLPLGRSPQGERG